MKKFKLKAPKYSFDHEGMIIRGEQLEILPLVDVYARDLCDDNMDIMSKANIRRCMVHGNDFAWRYGLNELEPLEPLEPIKVTLLDYEILKFVKKQGARYICRDENEVLNLFENEPYIINECSTWNAKGQWDFLGCFTKQLFQFVTWESQKYYVIKDVLNNCEVIEDE